MSNQRIERISITLPAELLRFADREAKRLHRSRSWVIADALRRAAEPCSTPPADLPSRVVREPAPPPYAGSTVDLGESRRGQLIADLALSPEQRVREAEETARLGDLLAKGEPIQPLILFDRYEDYLRWSDRLPRVR